MSAPDPEGMSLLAKVLAAGVAVIAPVWGAWAWLDKRLDKKADKHSVASQFQTVTNELAHQRDTQAKIFDQIRENEGKSEERHRELMMHLLEKRK